VSTGTPDVDELSRDELEKRVDELERKVDRFEERAASKTQLLSLIGALGVDVEDYTADPLDYKRDVIEIGVDIEDAAEKTTRALSTVKQIDDGSRADGGPSKTRTAATLSRDVVVRRALTRSGSGGGVTGREVINMAESRGIDLCHRTVQRGWKQATTEWEELVVQDPHDRDKRLAVDADDISEELLYTVDESLSETDLTERFSSGVS